MDSKAIHKLKRILFFAIIGIGTFFIVQVGYNSYISYREDRLSQEARVLYEQTKPSPAPTVDPETAPPAKTEDAPVKPTPPVAIEKVIQPEFEALRRKYNNDDIVGYLKIDDTSIDYPVLQSSDNDFYLTRGIDKKANIAGSLYLDFENDVLKEDKNSIIYGHNMKQDIMFHSIRNFANYDYYKERKYITFNTIYDNLKWEIFAFYVADTDNFYYLDVNFRSSDDYMSLVDTMVSKSQYDTGVTVNEDDRILTLSTCTNIQETTRYVLNAKLVEVNGIPYENIIKERKDYEIALAEYEKLMKNPTSTKNVSLAEEIPNTEETETTAVSETPSPVKIAAPNAISTPKPQASAVPNEVPSASPESAESPSPTTEVVEIEESAIPLGSANLSEEPSESSGETYDNSQSTESVQPSEGVEPAVETLDLSITDSAPPAIPVEIERESIPTESEIKNP